MNTIYSLSSANALKINSTFHAASLRAKDTYYRNEQYIFAPDMFNAWTTIYPDNTHFLIDTNTASNYGNSFEFKGLATKFSRLRSLDEIADFANKYGLLGFAVPSSNRATFFQRDKCISVLELHSPSLLEPIDLWFDAIKRVDQLLKLYRALSKMNKTKVDTIEENILTVGENTDGIFRLRWKNGDMTHTVISHQEFSILESIDVYRRVFIEEIQAILKDGTVKISPKTIQTKKAPLGISIIEAPYTPYLITAIYYDLWKMLIEDVQIELCAFEECNLPFIKSKRQLYCNDSCKQAAYRSRKENKVT